jgi:hypothetical protein
MSDVLLFERAAPSFAAGLARRGHHIVYRAHESNHCPGCGRSNWYIGRVSAECGFCGTAIPLAETSRHEAATLGARSSSRKTAGSADQRRYPRRPAKSRKLQLLIDGSPASFALQNISEGGALGESPAELVPGAKVHVRFEGGILIPAVVKWAEDGHVGLAFLDPVMLDGAAKSRN